MRSEIYIEQYHFRKINVYSAYELHNELGGKSLYLLTLKYKLDVLKTILF